MRGQQVLVDTLDQCGVVVERELTESPRQVGRDPTPINVVWWWSGSLLKVQDRFWTRSDARGTTLPAGGSVMSLGCRVAGRRKNPHPASRSNAHDPQRSAKRAAYKLSKVLEHESLEMGCRKGQSPLSPSSPVRNLGPLSHWKSQSFSLQKKLLLTPAAP